MPIHTNGWNIGGNLEDMNFGTTLNAMKTARLLAGVDDHDPDNLKLVPRLPANWKGVKATEWVISHNVGVRKQTQIDFNYQHLQNKRYSLELKSEKPLKKITVRCGPFLQSTPNIMVLQGNEKLQFETYKSGPHNWADVTFTDVSNLDLTIIPSR